MSQTVKKRDREDYKGYLRYCTDAQVLGVLAKERKAGRWAYVRLAELEQARRESRQEARGRS